MELDATAAALTAARRLLDEAATAAVAVQRDVAALADATNWRARATDAYRAGVAALEGELGRLRIGIDRTDDEVAAAQRATAWRTGG